MQVWMSTVALVAAEGFAGETVPGAGVVLQPLAALSVI